MVRLYAALAALALFLGLGWYAKVATERAALAEAAVETLAAGYEQYEDRIKEADAELSRRDKKWKGLEHDYQKQIDRFKRVPPTQCDLAAVDSGITDSLLSAAGYDKEGRTDPDQPDRTGTASRTPAYISNRGQSEWIAGYQQRLDQCNTNLSAIRTLQEQADAPDS